MMNAPIDKHLTKLLNVENLHHKSMDSEKVKTLSTRVAVVLVVVLVEIVAAAAVATVVVM